MAFAACGRPLGSFAPAPVAATAAANGVRLAVNVVCGLIAVYWLDLGMIGFFASVALGFAVYAALLVWAVVRAKEPETAAAVAKAA
jgi:hypothetical protein